MAGGSAVGKSENVSLVTCLLSSYTETMPADKISVNLLQQDVMANSPWNRIMNWITSYGRYIMITTELIVLIAFASRFGLDRKLTDLKENITEKQEILEVNADLEKEIREAQEKINLIKQLIMQQSVPVDTLLLIQMLLPTGSYFDLVTIDTGKVTANITTNSSESFSKLLSNFSFSKKLNGVEIGKIVKKPTGIQFTVSAKIHQTQKIQT